MSTPVIKANETTKAPKLAEANLQSSPTSTHAQYQAYDIIITCADGLESPLQIELESMGINSTLKGTGRIEVLATLEQIYTICLWSRVASRVLLPIKKRNINAEYDIAEQLNGLAKSVDWTQWFGLDNTFAIRMNVDKRTQVSQQFAMLRIKDAIVDTFADKLDARPDVDSDHPDFSFYATVNDKQAEIYLDLSGMSLHRRGYRVAMTDAPLKENLAAALLYTTGWHIKDKFSALIDPMCGSGTFIIEALLMHCDYPVGIDKVESQFGFYHWHAHDSELWQACVAKAQERFHHGLTSAIAGNKSDNNSANNSAKLPTIIGFDADAGAIKATHKNLMAAGLHELIPHLTLEQRPLSQLRAGLAKAMQEGQLNHALVITNPPYGERLGDTDFIKPLYQGLGLHLQDCFASTSSGNNHATLSLPTLGVLAAHVEQADVLPIDKPQTLRCHNGAITVYFRHGSLIPDEQSSLISQFEKRPISVDEAQDFVNRLQKNVAKLKKLAQKEDVTNLRVYDADLPDYKVAIDIYGNYAHVQEYAPPKTIPPETAKKRFNLALMGIREVFGIDREQVFIKTRARQSGNSQYGNPDGIGKPITNRSKNANKDKPTNKDQRNHYKGNKYQQAREEAKKQAARDEAQKKRKLHVVQEDGAYFYVNFTDYLDTGLFIDHRNMRGLIRSVSRGCDVLNLFAYTCSASVHAALAGAKSVTSVDLSQNYLDWGKQNFALNGLDVTSPKYQFVASDIFDWIKDNTEQFDIIFIDPPTFSNSKKFQGTFDVQRDHAALINRAMNRLDSNGILYFSNNYTKFELDEELYERYEVTNITHQTIGFDFNIKKPIHQSFEIRHKV